MLFTTNQKKTERLRICEGCSYYKAHTRSCGELLRPRKLRNGVKLCGCFMPAKARLKTSSCPAGKWGAIVSKKDLEEMRRVIGYTGNLTAEQVTEIVEAYNKATGDNARATSCPSCIEQMKAALSQFLAIDEEAEIQEATKKQALLYPEKKVESKGGKQEE